MSEYPNTNTRKTLSRNRTNTNDERTREPKSSPTRNQTSPDAGRLKPPNTQPLSPGEQSKAEESFSQSLMGRIFRTKKRRQRAAIDERLSRSKNNVLEAMFINDVPYTGNTGKTGKTGKTGNTGKTGKLVFPFSLENEDNKFEECGNINGGITRCEDPNYSICAKARRRFQKSLEKKYGENSKFQNCLTPRLVSGEKKTHRNRGCCISKKKYGLGIQFKRLKRY